MITCIIKKNQFQVFEQHTFTPCHVNYMKLWAYIPSHDMHVPFLSHQTHNICTTYGHCVHSAHNLDCMYILLYVHNVQ